MENQWYTIGPGIWVLVLSGDAKTDHKSCLQWYKPNAKSVTDDIITHTYIEDVCFVKGGLSDVTLGQGWGPGACAYRQPGMKHGTYKAFAIYLMPSCATDEVTQENHVEYQFGRAAASLDDGLQQIATGTRSQFFEDCDSGVYDNVVTIGRTVDSVQFTGLFDAELIAKLPSSVKFICHNGAGYDQIDVEACIEKGILVSNTPSVVNDATADTTILLLLAALRRAWIPQYALRNGLWSSSSPLGRDPEGLVLGILGLGGIGSAVAKRAASFDLRLQYHNQSPVSASVMSRLSLDAADEPKYVSFEELLRTSDIISVHVPLSPKTIHLIGKKEIDMMKDNAIIINTARGPVIDESALVGGLESGKIWSAGLDVFEREPNIHPELMTNENVILLPHIGTATVDTRKRMEATMLENVRNSLIHKQLLTPIPELEQTGR
ncbi:hypothetical protein N7474_011253 [Penicillium riverlandense]|uniref:uncharacterized protein n=1 Tax=Penicillium riverlandense TaxID=1903569 RepID=UPI002548E842|nr:uncharacterized protein N7474_011253 [Penicillium riverlandense]KAJ5805366.1 hypothetical protein N7474_011253 [Penicillium riverlandense]